MATERIPHPDDHAPHRDDPYSTESDELPVITREDVMRVIEKIEAGRASNSFHFSPDDFDVFMYLKQGQWREIERDPSSLLDVLAPYVHA